MSDEINSVPVVNNIETLINDVITATEEFDNQDSFTLKELHIISTDLEQDYGITGIEEFKKQFAKYNSRMSYDRQTKGWKFKSVEKYGDLDMLCADVSVTNMLTNDILSTVIMEGVEAVIKRDHSIITDVIERYCDENLIRLIKQEFDNTLAPAINATLANRTSDLKESINGIIADKINSISFSVSTS
jgi:hypothetical protein